MFTDEAISFLATLKSGIASPKKQARNDTKKQIVEAFNELNNYVLLAVLLSSPASLSMVAVSGKVQCIPV